MVPQAQIALSPGLPVRMEAARLRGHTDYLGINEAEKGKNNLRHELRIAGVIPSMSTAV
jgi:hypothetical protein